MSGGSSWYQYREVAPKEGATSTLYEVKKFDSDLDVKETYHIARGGGSFTCTCPAGFKWCRHKKMLVGAFKEHPDRIGTGWFFSHDAQQWMQPINNDV